MFILKYEFPAKALAIKSMFPIVSCYKKSRFSLNLWKQLYCHENKNNHCEFFEFQEVSVKEKNDKHFYSAYEDKIYQTALSC